MPTTSRLEWIYPTEDQKAWWAIWQAFVNQQDADVWASFENAFLVLSGGGDIYLDAAADTLYWSADWYVRSLLTMGTVRIPAGDSKLEDGQIVYVDISRPLLGNSDVTLQVTSSPLTGPDQRNKVFIAARVGDELIMRPWQGRPQSITFDDTFNTGSIAATSYWEKEIDIHSIKSGEFQLVKLSLDSGTSDNADIVLYDRDPSDIATVILYQATGKNVQSDPFADPNMWWGEVNAQGSLWARVYNQGAAATSFNLRIRMRNDDTETFTE